MGKKLSKCLILQKLFQDHNKFFNILHNLFPANIVRRMGKILQCDIIRRHRLIKNDYLYTSKGKLYINPFPCSQAV